MDGPGTVRVTPVYGYSDMGGIAVAIHGWSE